MSLKNAIQDVILWRGLNFLSVFILNILVARFFEASQAGNIFFFINNLSLVILVLSFSLESGLGFYGASGQFSSGQLGLLAFAWCVFGSLLSFLLFGSIRQYLVLDGMNSRLAAICFIAGSLLTSFFSALYFAKQKFIAPNLWLLIINTILVLFFLAGIKGSVSGQQLLHVYFAGFLVQGIGIVLLYFFGTNNQAPVIPVRDIVGKIVKYSATVFLSNFIFFLVYRIDYWFVEVYCTPVELGNYIQVSRIIQWLLLVPMMISSVLFPLTAAGKDKEMVGKIVLVSRILLWVFFIGSIILASIGSWAFVWIFGKTYTYMYPVFLLHIPGLLALAALYPVSSYNAGIKRVDINLQGSFLALLAIVLFNILFTPAYGIYAASLASSIGYLVYFIFSFYQFNKINGISLLEFYKPVKTDYHFLKSMLYRQK